MGFWFHGLLGLASFLSILNQIAGTVLGGQHQVRKFFHILFRDNYVLHIVMPDQFILLLFLQMLVLIVDFLSSSCCSRSYFMQMVALTTIFSLTNHAIYQSGSGSYDLQQDDSSLHHVQEWIRSYPRWGAKKNLTWSRTMFPLMAWHKATSLGIKYDYSFFCPVPGAD